MQQSLLSRSLPVRSGKIIAAVLVMCVTAIMIGSFAVVSAQEPVIFTGELNLPRGEDVQSLPEAEAVYTDLWAVQVAPGTDLNSISRSAGFENLGQIGNLQGFYLIRAAGTAARSENVTATLRSMPGILWAEQQIARQMYPRVPTDPLVGDQWHLNNTGQSGVAGNDANVFAAWNAGYTGNGVRIAIVDDGLQINHPDIAPNYFAAGSWDFNSNEANPTGGPTNDHGTAAGGVSAAADDGASCGVGVAYNAQIAGLRLIAAAVTDAKEADALGYAFQLNDIYNNSWGPNDNGSTLGKPGTLMAEALANGAANGRGGRGSIFVWAGGNGYNAGDHANADGYANSRYVIAVAASTDNGTRSYYSEVGANIMVNAPSNGGVSGITTTDLTGANGYSTGNCTSGFGGTSSAAPLVAGVTGLMLEANPNLTWRDVMHVLINSAEKNDPSGTGVRQWEVNGAGHDINYAYGFGRVDAGAAVVLANTWTNVPANVTPYDSGVMNVNQAIPDGTGNPGQGPAISRTVNVPQDFVVEHVEVVLNINHAYRGDIIAAIESPDGTSSTLLFPRSGDNNHHYSNWKTSSLRHWGEQSGGTWTLRVADFYAGTTGTLNSWQLIIHGYSTGGDPETPVPGELVKNGGFEVLNGAGKPVIDPWVVKNQTGDKPKCNKPEKSKYFAYSGNCAFRFKGGPGEKGNLQQVLDTSAVNLQTGDTLEVTWMMSAPASSSGKIKFVVKYDDGTPPTKIKGAVLPTLNGEYEPWGNDPLHPPTVASSSVKKVKFNIKNTSPSGKILVDNVSIIHTSASARVLDLPGTVRSDQTAFGPR